MLQQPWSGNLRYASCTCSSANWPNTDIIPNTSCSAPMVPPKAETPKMKFQANKKTGTHPNVLGGTTLISVSASRIYDICVGFVLTLRDQACHGMACLVIQLMMATKRPHALSWIHYWGSHHVLLLTLIYSHLAPFQSLFFRPWTTLLTSAP
jgi:hypothetical protein